MLKDAKSAHSLERREHNPDSQEGRCQRATQLQTHKPALRFAYKLFTKVIINRISESLDFKQRREQAGFRKGYSTIDHIHVINQIIEKSAEYNKPFYMSFIDNKKAFDSVQIAQYCIKGPGNSGDLHTALE